MYVRPGSSWFGWFDVSMIVDIGTPRYPFSFQVHIDTPSDRPISLPYIVVVHEYEFPSPFPLTFLSFLIDPP